MTATLKIMLDQVVAPTDPDLGEASRELARGLISQTPVRCELEAIVPAGGTPLALTGVARVKKVTLPRAQLASAAQLGLATGVGGGMIHSPTLLAPLVRHDRVNNNDQTVVTLWDLSPWTDAAHLPRTTVAWHRAMLKRAAKHADAIVVPTDSMAVALAEMAPVAGRVRVIPGAASPDLAAGTRDRARLREVGIPEEFVLLAGGMRPADGLAVGFAGLAASGIDLPVVVIDAPEGSEPAVMELAASAGVPERRVHVRSHLSLANRGAVLGAAVAFVAPGHVQAFPWRVVDALTLGVPVVAAATPAHTDVVADGGALIDGDGPVLADGIAAELSLLFDAVESTQRAAVLAADRGRAFSWAGAASRVWQLHADL